jgi:hypothetical protein
MMKSIRRTRACAAYAGLAGLMMLTACQDDDSFLTTPPLATPQFTVSGRVSNLATGRTVTIDDNGADALEVTANGTFEFATPVDANGAYKVTVASQPAGQVCTVSNGVGSGVVANITGVSVTCSTDTYTVGGTLSGLASGAHVVLADNGQDPVTLTADGAFAFAAPVAYDGSYAVTVTTQPSGATCTVTRGVGAGVTANIATVAVVCSNNSYTIGGMVSGLAGGEQVTLDDNGADALTVTSSGAFTFSTPVAAQGSYNVTVGTQPVGEICSVSAGGASGVLNNVTSVLVTCSTDTYTIGGSVTGLAGGAQITLDDNGADALTLSADGAFTFATPVAYGGSYAVTVGTQPSGQYCIVTGGAGTNVSANQSGVGVSCQSNPVSYSTAGSYTFTVPTGITSLQVVATGAGGGGGGLFGTNPGSAGGAGAVVTSTIAVTAGQSLTLVVGGGGGGGTDGPGSSGSYTCGAGGGGGGSTNIAVGTAYQIIAGGGGGGGSCNNGTAGGSGGGVNGAGGAGATKYSQTGGSGGANGVGGAGGNDGMGDFGVSGADGAGGPGGVGGSNGGTTYPGGVGGAGVGSGAGGADGNNDLSGGGGGGYGGGGSGTQATGGGAGGSVGPAGTQYAAAANGGTSATAGGDGSIVITMM